MTGNPVQTVLIVDDEAEIRENLSYVVTREGFRVITAPDGPSALKLCLSDMPDVLLLDVHMPDMDGMEVMRRVKELDGDLPVVIITAFAGVSEAVDAMKKGAHDYLAKPFDIHEVARVVRRAMTERGLKRRLLYLSSRVQETGSLAEMMGTSDKVMRLVADVHTVAKSDFSVIILGETGSGKELVARTIHQVSRRSGEPFIPVDCGAIPESLLESELFGHEKGAFTSADRQTCGKFEQAHKGTLFLDEITNMPLGSQAKLLRALQEKAIHRVGGAKAIPVDARLLAACNQDLPALHRNGRFREDLYYRLNEFTIVIPPLRERKEDIFYLAKRFMDMTNLEINKLVRGFSEGALEVMLNYDWPGNVRQLRAEIRRAVLLADETITEEHISVKRTATPGLAFTPKVEGMPWQTLSLREIVDRGTESVEREVLAQVLKYTGGNKAKAARLLKIDYKTIHTKLKKFGIAGMNGEGGKDDGKG